jgi:predicted amidophosphoribosyltransferase
MRFMYEHALGLVTDGLTTLEEIQRVVPTNYRASATCVTCQSELSETNRFCPHCGTKVGGGEAFAQRQEHPEIHGVARQ